LGTRAASFWAAKMMAENLFTGDVDEKRPTNRA